MRCSLSARRLLRNAVLALCVSALLIVPDGPVVQAESAPVYHVVRNGETLSHIAVRFRTSVKRLIKETRDIAGRAEAE